MSQSPVEAPELVQSESSTCRVGAYREEALPYRLVVRSPGRFGAAGAIVLLALATPSTGIATTAVDPNVVQVLE